MIKNLKNIKEFMNIKKHYRTAKRHKSYCELEKVKLELLDFQEKLINENQLTDSMNFEMFSLFADIDDARINLKKSNLENCMI